MAIQSILPDSEPSSKPPLLIPTTKSQIKPITTTPPTKMYSQYEVIPANSKSKMEVRQIQSSGGLSVTGMGGTPIMLPMIHRQKVKVIPPNQFMQLKPPSGNSQKVYTLKSPVGMKNGPQLFTVKSQQPGKQQVFTVKSTASQFIPTSTVVSSNQTKLNNSIILNQGKFTIMKSVETTKPDLSNTNIFDIPIVFADNEGNFQENPVQSTSQPIFITNQQQNHDGAISQQQPLNRNIIINSSLANKTKGGNKVVLINRSSLKGHNIITKAVPQLKYTKVMVSNPNKLKHEDVLMAAGTSNTTTTSFESQKVYPIATTSQTNQILNSSFIRNTKYSPIVINVDSDKTTFKNIIKVGDTQIKPAANTIVFKPGNFKQIPMLKPGILNRNLTVRKVVNIVQKKPVVEQLQTQQIELKKQQPPPQE